MISYVMLCNVYVESHVVPCQFYFHDSFRIHSETQRYKSFKSHRLSEHKFWSSFKKSNWFIRDLEASLRDLNSKKACEFTEISAHVIIPFRIIPISYVCMNFFKMPLGSILWQSKKYSYLIYYFKNSNY